MLLTKSFQSTIQVQIKVYPHKKKLKGVCNQPGASNKSPRSGTRPISTARQNQEGAGLHARTQTVHTTPRTHETAHTTPRTQANGTHDMSHRRSNILLSFLRTSQAANLTNPPPLPLLGSVVVVSPRNSLGMAFWSIGSALPWLALSQLPLRPRCCLRRRGRSR